MARLTDQQRIERLEQRVAELEDTLLYVAQTLGANQMLAPVEVEVAQRMYSSNRQLRPGGR